GAAVVAGWYFFGRGSGTPPATVAEATPPPATVPPATAPPASLEPAGAPPTTVASTTATSLAVVPTTAPAATVPPATTPANTPTRPARAQENPRTARVDDPPNAGSGAPSSGGGNVFLDQEPPEVDGVEAGARAAEGYRSNSGRSSGSGFGTSRVLQRRELSPRPQGQQEAAAIFAVRHLINAETLYNKKNGRYGSLTELVRAGVLPLANLGGDGNTFSHRGYRFELEAAGESFRVTALPQAGGGRPFVGDESNYIRAGLE
ncbi:MAG TPA: hypothetical protein VI589_08220, partial [Vicinamibacteria bacterium]